MLENYDSYCKRCDEILGWIMRGRDEGKAIGSNAKEQEIIRNMLDNNMSLEDISKATKLTIDEIKKNNNVNNAC